MAGNEVQEYVGENYMDPRCWLRWRPTSMAQLVEAENKMLKVVKEKIISKFVPIRNGTEQIRTIIMNKDSQGVPVVLVHGMGSGVGLWSLNLDAFSRYRPVYAFDILGFGRSSRPIFSKEPMLVEMEFVESIEEWRKNIGLEKFVLLGHSLGGFLCASYAIRYPEHLYHLVLVDPWGFPEKPSKINPKVPRWIRAVVSLLSPFNPLASLRAAGPWGPGLVQRFRADILEKYASLYDNPTTVADYIYHCNAQDPSGEAGFRTLNTSFGWAKCPMICRVAEIHADVPMTMIHGSRSWVDSGIGYEVKYLRNNSFVDVQVIKGAGHHVYADKYDMFNLLVNRLCQQVESRKMAITPDSEDSQSHHVRPPPHVSSESALGDLISSPTEENTTTVDLHKSNQLEASL